MLLAIYGAGGLGREIYDLACLINATAKKWGKIVFIKDNRQESIINGAEVLIFDEFKVNYSPRDARVVIAVGEPRDRQTLREKLMADGYALQTLVHPSVFIGSDTEIDDGTIIQFGCFVSCNVKLGTNVLLQPNSNVGHDSFVGADAIISTGVAISGVCVIGERAYIGVGVPVKDHTSIGADSIVGMGSVVSRDIPENVIALGNPARVMKYNESGRVF